MRSVGRYRKRYAKTYAKTGGTSINLVKESVENKNFSSLDEKLFATHRRFR